MDVLIIPMWCDVRQCNAMLGDVDGADGDDRQSVFRHNRKRAPTAGIWYWADEKLNTDFNWNGKKRDTCCGCHNHLKQKQKIKPNREQSKPSQYRNDEVNNNENMNNLFSATYICCHNTDFQTNEEKHTSFLLSCFCLFLVA